jgi:hypothetical protein
MGMHVKILRFPNNHYVIILTSEKMKYLILLKTKDDFSANSLARLTYFRHISPWLVSCQSFGSLHKTALTELE